MAAYWKGSPGARVTLAFSSDGKRFTSPVPAERDEIGRARGDGTTYGALQNASGAVAVRLTTDRPLRRVTVLGLTDRRATVRSRPIQVGPSAEAATTEPAVVSRASYYDKVRATDAAGNLGPFSAVRSARTS